MSQAGTLTTPSSKSTRRSVPDQISLAALCTTCSMPQHLTPPPPTTFAATTNSDGKPIATSTVTDPDPEVRPVPHNAWLLWRAGQWPELVDRSLGNGTHDYTMERHVHVALLCVQESADDRLAMDEVVRMLSSGEGVALPEPKQPAYFNVRPVGTEMSASCDMTISITLSR